MTLVVTVLVQLGLMYAVLHVWSEVSDYRLITLKLTLVAVLFTLSLNIINGYMGEFSCSHPWLYGHWCLHVQPFYRGPVYQRQGTGRCRGFIFRRVSVISAGACFSVGSWRHWVP
jgi:hypothetical protein